MESLSKLLNILEVAFGLGFVIFLHELGHFLLAKWNGVKVEKFSIGFGRTLIGFRRGETEYVLAAIPLGGFVKMLGEGMEDSANRSTDPRAYPNKSVLARMAIISAGVIMNVLLGMACFVFAYGRGMEEIPAKVRAVKAGAPAYEAGLLPGDEIVALDGRRDISYNSMTLHIFLSGAGQKVRFDVKRPGHEGLVPFEIEPKREEADLVPKIGVLPSLGLELAEPPFLAQAGMTIDAATVLKTLKPEDRLVAIGPKGGELEKLVDDEDVRRKLSKYRTQDVDLVFERRIAGKQGKDRHVEEIKLTLPPNHVVDFGFRLTIEPVASIRAESPAAKAGFRPGDRILKVDGNADFDPMRLADLCYDHAGSPMTFEVERASAGAESKVVTLEATPEALPPWSEPLGGNLQDVPGLGLAFPVRAKIVSVAPGSPADRAGLRPGAVISKVTVAPVPEIKGAKPESIELNDKPPGWVSVFWPLQGRPPQEVELSVNGSSKPIRIKPEPVADWYNSDRGLFFQVLSRRLPPLGVEAALRRGFDDTVENIVRIYTMLRSLVQGRVSPKLLGGPIMIAATAYRSADTGMTYLIHFLGILSINLAVLNFLPIPPLDGGQMMFLIAEGIRGRPVPESAVNVVSWIGILLLLGLMVYVMYQDILRQIGF